MNSWKQLRRGAAALVLGGTVGLFGACDAVDNMLRVENPERLMERDLNDPRMVEVLTSSVIGLFQSMYDDPFIWQGSMLTDEQLTGINWESTARVNQRLVSYDEGPADDMFSELSAARMMADTVAGRFRTLLKSPDSDARMATVLAYSGYSYVLMGEAMCEATINVGETIHTPEQLFGMAVERFEKALAVAGAAGSSDLQNLARTGLARAHLNLGNTAEVQRYAAEVPEDFVWWVEYSENSPSEDNTLYSRTRGANHSLGVHPRFLNGEFGATGIVDTQTDPRIQHTPSWSKGHNALTLLYKPFQSLPYSGYNGETIAEGGSPQLVGRDTDIKLASGLEALHHFYEAAGPNAVGPAGTTLEFVNARREFGNQDAVVLTGADLMAELREQRARDLYLGGFRLGDLRRWKRQGIGDFFPSGEHPTSEWGQYGDATCFPLPLEEYEGNPHITRP